MGVYMNIAVMAKDSFDDRLILVKDISNVYNNNIIRNYIRENDLGTSMENVQVSPEVKQWMTHGQEMMLSLSDFKHIYHDLDKKIKLAKDKISWTKKIVCSSPEVYDRMLEDIEMLNYSIYGNSDEAGMVDVIDNFKALEAIVKYVIDDFTIDRKVLASNDFNSIYIAWWMG